MAALLLMSCDGDGAGDVATAPSTTAATTSAPTTASPTTATSATATTTGSTTAGATAASTSTAAPTTVPPTTAAAPGVAQLGDGLVEAMSPDGSNVMVSRVIEGLSVPGCEGQPEPVLVLAPVAGGEAVAALPDNPEYNGTVTDLGSGRVALVAGCEEFLSGIVVTDQAPTGALSGATEVPSPSGQPIDAILDIGAADPAALVALAGRFGATGNETAVVRIDLATGVTTELLQTGEADFLFGVLADGTYALGDGVEVRVVHPITGQELSAYPGEFLAVSPDGTTLAVVGPGVVLVSPPAAPAPLLEPPAGEAPVIDAAWAPAGDRLAIVRRGVEDTLAVVDRAGTVIELDTARRIVRLAWSADGSTLAYTRLLEGTGGELGDFEVRAVRVPPATAG